MWEGKKPESSILGLSKNCCICFCRLGLCIRCRIDKDEGTSLPNRSVPDIQGQIACMSRGCTHPGQVHRRHPSSCTHSLIHISHIYHTPAKHARSRIDITSEYVKRPGIETRKLIIRWPDLMVQIIHPLLLGIDSDSRFAHQCPRQGSVHRGQSGERARWVREGRV